MPKVLKMRRAALKHLRPCRSVVITEDNLDSQEFHDSRYYSDFLLGRRRRAEGVLLSIGAKGDEKRSRKDSP